MTKIQKCAEILKYRTHIDNIKILVYNMCIKNECYLRNYVVEKLIKSERKKEA